MKIDKRNGNVNYNDEEHIYWDNSGNYISVTTLIGKYENEYDKDFWSSYKALQEILTAEQFKFEKKHLLRTKKVDLKYFLDAYQINETNFNLVKQNILDKWQHENKASCDRGTRIHAELEKMYIDKKETDLKKFGLGGKFQVNTNESLDNNNIKLLDIEKGIFPEFLIYTVSKDGIVKVAGQIDLLIKDGNNIIIYDYKTNKKIDETSYFDFNTKKNQMMKYPLNNLMDCNKMHYAMQLSTYAWMLQKINPEFKIKYLGIIHYDHNNNVTEYEIPYLKEDVERMLKDYKKKLIIKQREDSRKPIVF